VGQTSVVSHPFAVHRGLVCGGLIMNPAGIIQKTYFYNYFSWLNSESEGIKSSNRDNGLSV
jgi:hypothetical protein